jgi:hypothetical protein
MIQELRIGNWVRLMLNHSDYNEFPIELADFNLIANESRNHLYQPIPLTLEILEKCGFVITRISAHPNNIWTLKFEEGIFELEQIKSFFLCSSQYEVEVKYLHQLQNLYFALTNEELTFKQ